MNKLFKDLKDKIKNNFFDIIFFDIFDTIILRKVHPEYVKKIFSKKLKEYYGLKISSENLYKIRFKIEADLCQKNEKDGFDLEFLFDDFCKTLFITLEKDTLIDAKVSFDEFLSTCQKLEIDAEIATQVIDDEVINLAKEAKKEGMAVYCLSDFYLSKEMLTRLFVAHGIADVFEDIIVSSEFLVTKRSGRLYKKILQDRFIDKKIAMIGDNSHSDYDMAREHGLDAYLLDREKQRNFYQVHKKEVLSHSEFHRSIIAIILDDYSSSKPIYFKEMAFTLYYFIYRLYLELVSSGVKDIFFLSREGEFLKKLFDIFLEFNNISDINTHYLIVSRKSTFIASLKPLENEKFETLFRQYRKMSIVVFLKSLNFTTSEIEKLHQKKKWDFNQLKEDLPTSKIFTELLEDKDFQQIYEQKRASQKEYLQRYIYSFGADVEQDGLALVDAGWKGTIQDHIFKSLDKKVEVTGYYIGLVTDLMVEELNLKKGLVFDYQNMDKYDKIFKENMAIFEVLLGASHGSADRYEENSDNTIEPITYQEKEEAVIFTEVVNPIQEVLYTIFQKIADKFLLYHVSILDMRKEVASVHARMMYEPTKEEIDFFRQLYHFENFGLFEFSTFDKYKTTDRKKQLQYIAKFIKNPKSFLSSTFWKAAALDDIGLLPIYKMYGLYQKMKIFKVL